MLKNIIYYSKSVFILAVIFVGLLSSCERGRIDHSTYIPLNSYAVISVNTKEIFNDAIFDLISSSDLKEIFDLGPLANLIADPGNAGLIRFDRYYIFGSGNNSKESRLGMILPLSDHEKLSSYLLTNFNIEIREDGIYKIAEINKNVLIVWDKQTAIYIYAPSAEYLLNDVKKYFVQNYSNSLAKKDSIFRETLVDPSHVVAWFKNDEFLNNLDIGLENTFDLNLLEILKIKKKEFKDGKSVFSLNFYDSKITVDSKQYLGKKKLALHKKLVKTNTISSIVNSAGTENPVVALSASLNKEGLLRYIETFGLDKTFSQMLVNFKSPINIDLEFFLRFFEGDVVFFLNEFENVKSNKMVQQLNIEGEQEQVMKEFTEKRPQITAVLSLKKDHQLEVFLKMIARRYLRTDGIYNYNDLLYFTIKNDNLCITTTSKGIKVIKGFTGRLNPVLTEILTKNRLAASIDMKRTFEFISEGNIIEKEVCETISKNLNKVVITDQGLNDSEIITGKIEIIFNSKDHALISSVKFMDQLLKSLNPLIYELF